MHHADAGRSRGRGRRLPLPHDSGKKVVAVGSVFIHRLVGVRAVVPDGGGADERSRTSLETREGLGKKRGSASSALQNTPPPIGGPSLRDALASQMNDNVQPLECGRRKVARFRVPSDVTRPRIRTGARDALDGVTASGKCGEERGADQPRRSGYGDAKGAIVRADL